MAKNRVLQVGGSVVEGNSVVSVPTVDVRKLAHLRHSAYRLFGALFVYPDRETLDSAVDLARRTRRSNRWTAQMAFYQPWQNLLRCLETITPAQFPQVEKAYRDLFGHGTRRKPVQLHESAYLSPAAVASTGEVIGDLEVEYSSSGLSVSADSGESPDHAAVQMEYVSYLCDIESESWESGDRKKAIEIVGRERRFIERHPNRWFGSLARAVEERHEDGLFTQLVRAARAMVVHDSDLLTVIPEWLEPGTSGQPVEGETA